MQSVMESVREDQFREQAAFELQNRIRQTEQICDQFRKSYSGYSSLVRQVFFIVVLGAVIGACAYIASNAQVILAFLETQNFGRDLLLIKAALTGISLYAALHILKLMLRIGKISKIDSFVSKVRNIEQELRRTLGSMDNIAGSAARIISGSKNEKLKPASSIDSEINNYSGLAGTYTKDNHALNTALTLVHWLSGIVFAGTLLLIGAPFLTEKFGNRFIFGEHNPIVLLYTAIVLSLYMLIQESFAKGSVEQLHTKCKNAAGIIFMAGFFGLVLYHLVWRENSVFRGSFTLAGLSDNALQLTLACIPLAIGAAFSSLICHITRRGLRIINLVYIGCTAAVPALFLWGLSSFPMENYGNFWQTFLALSLPLAAAILFSTAFAVMGGVKSKVFISILIGGGLYAITVIIILVTRNISDYAVYAHFLSVFGSVNTVARVIVIGAIVVAILAVHDIGFTVVGVIAIVLLLTVGIILKLVTAVLFFAVAVFTPLLPGLLVLLIAAHTQEQRTKNTVVFMAAAISAVILISVYTNSGTSLPVSPSESFTNIYVTSDALNVRAGPSADADTVTPSPLYYGTMIQLIEGFKEGTWIKIKYNDVEGWVNSAHTAAEPPPAR